MHWRKSEKPAHEKIKGQNTMFERTPLWLIMPALLVLFLVTVEAGYRGRRWLDQRLQALQPPEGGGQDYLLSAVLGLLALLLGFTFSLGLNRYEARRDLVVQEANAIGTAWLRADLLEEPVRSRLRSNLLAYVDARLEWSRSGELEMRDEARIQKSLWQDVGLAVRVERSEQVSRALMDAVNESFDLASARQAARAAHIPDRVLVLLVLYAFLSVLMLGYVAGGTGRQHRIAIGLLLVLLCLAISLILDIDRPRAGAIQVSQQPMEILRQSLN